MEAAQWPQSRAVNYPSMEQFIIGYVILHSRYVCLFFYCICFVAFLQLQALLSISQTAHYFSRAYDGMLFENSDSLQEESQRSVIKN